MAEATPNNNPGIWRRLDVPGDTRQPPPCKQHEGGHRGSRGQAQIELLACLPALLLAGLIAAQLLVAAYSQSLGDGAAEAAAIALADGRDPEQAAIEAMPGWAEGRIDVSTEDGIVAVAVRAPALIPGLGDRLELRSDAYALPAEGS